MPKVANATAAQVRADIPNIGKSISQDLHGLGIQTLLQVTATAPIATYEALRTSSG